MIQVPFYSLDYVERDLGSSLGGSVDGLFAARVVLRSKMLLPPIVGKRRVSVWGTVLMP